MKTMGSDGDGRRGLEYRVEVEEVLTPERIRWLGGSPAADVGRGSVFHVTVLDQADLHGRLRRLHDLNARLVSVARVEEQAR